MALHRVLRSGNEVLGNFDLFLQYLRGDISDSFKSGVLPLKFTHQHFWMRRFFLISLERNFSWGVWWLGLHQTVYQQTVQHSSHNSHTLCSLTSVLLLIHYGGTLGLPLELHALSWDVIWHPDLKSQRSPRLRLWASRGRCRCPDSRNHKGCSLYCMRMWCALLWQWKSKICSAHKRNPYLTDEIQALTSLILREQERLS